MHRPREQFVELTECVKYVIQSSDVIEESLRIHVREENSEKVVWYKERFLTDDEIIENVVENATSKLCWTIHRPKRGWYVRIRAPTFPPGAFIPLTPVPTTSPFHTDAALSFATRTNAPKRVSLSPRARASMSPSRSGDEDRRARKNDSVDSDATVVHSYPPTPPAIQTPPPQLPSPDEIRNRLSASGLSPPKKANYPPLPSEIKQFLFAPHSHPHHPQPQSTSLIARALSVFKNSTPSHSLSFTLCPVPSLDAPSNPTSPQPSSSSSSPNAGSSPPTDTLQNKRQSIIAKINDLVPPSPPALLIFHDRTPVWNFRSTTGLLEIDIAMERDMGIDRSFWIAIALAYMEFLTERESYLAAAGGD